MAATPAAAEAELRYERCPTGSNCSSTLQRAPGWCKAQLSAPLHGQSLHSVPRLATSLCNGSTALRT
jgi:hypothetical protein